MNENLEKVLKTLGTDKAFAEKMSQCKSPEEAYELARTVADGFTLEELQDVAAKLKKLVSESEKEELTDEELQEVAGGWGVIGQVETKSGQVYWVWELQDGTVTVEPAALAVICA